MSRFEKPIMPRILKSEGGKVDDPRDPGGRTNQGVTQRNFNNWLISQGKPSRDVFTMLDSERDAIYRKLYWDVVMGDRLLVGLDYVMMDGAVHSGPSQAVKWLQRALGPYYTGNIDGRMGDLTLQGVVNYPDPAKLINAVLDRRLAFLQALSTFAVYGKGWRRRVSEVRSIAVAEAKTGFAQDMLAPSVGRAPITDAKKLPSVTPGNVTATAGGTTGTVALGVERAQDMLAPYAGTSDIVQTIFIGLVVLGVGLTVGGIVWRFASTRKAAKLRDALNLDETPNAVA